MLLCLPPDLSMATEIGFDCPVCVQRDWELLTIVFGEFLFHLAKNIKLYNGQILRFTEPKKTHINAETHRLTGQDPGCSLVCSTCPPGRPRDI